MKTTVLLAIKLIILLTISIAWQTAAASAQEDQFSDRKWYKDWSSAKENFAKAVEKKESGDFQDAVEKYRAATNDLKKILRSKINQSDRPMVDDFLFNVYTDLASSLFELGTIEQAIYTQVEALKFVRAKQPYSDKADFRAYFALSEYYNFVDNYAQAEQAARRGIAAYRAKMNSALPARGNVEFCRALFGQQKYADAKTVCAATLKLTTETDASTRGMAQYYLGLICTNAGSGRKEQACEQYYASALKEFESEEAEKKDYYLIGSLHFMLEDYEKAKEYYEKFLAAYPRLDRARFNLGITYLRLSDKDKANDQLRELQKIRSKRAPELKNEIEKVFKESRK